MVGGPDRVFADCESAHDVDEARLGSTVDNGHLGSITRTVFGSVEGLEPAIEDL